jgi:hypothetical protein
MSRAWLHAGGVEPILKVADQPVQPLAVNVGLGRVDQRVAGGPFRQRQLVADARRQLGDQIVLAGQTRANGEARANKGGHFAVSQVFLEICVRVRWGHGWLLRRNAAG